MPVPAPARPPGTAPTPPAAPPEILPATPPAAPPMPAPAPVTSATQLVQVKKPNGFAPGGTLAGAGAEKVAKSGGSFFSLIANSTRPSSAKRSSSNGLVEAPRSSRRYSLPARATTSTGLEPLMARASGIASSRARPFASLGFQLARTVRSADGTTNSRYRSALRRLTFPATTRSSSPSPETIDPETLSDIFEGAPLVT